MPATIVIGDVIGVGFGKIDADAVVLSKQEELNAAIERHAVPVDPDAPSCCIDGRNCLYTLAGTKPEARPSVAGGIVTAFAAAEMTDWFAGDEGETTIDRLESLEKYLASSGIVSGNHVDDAHVKDNYADGRTGCGASDDMLKHMRNVIENPGQGVSGFVEQLLDVYDASLMPTDESVIDRTKDWDPVKAKDKLSPKAVEVLNSDGGGVYGHREFEVLFNKVKDPTVDRDGFVAETGQQIFVVDLWYIDKLAKAMARGPELQKQYQQLRQAMVAYQVGTYLSLCNGTQIYAVRDNA